MRVVKAAAVQLSRAPRVPEHGELTRARTEDARGAVYVRATAIVMNVACRRCHDSFAHPAFARLSRCRAVQGRGHTGQPGKFRVESFASDRQHGAAFGDIVTPMT